ncbi:GntR family transcriptional regulator [Salinibacterium sp. M195]|uniref:GntR family transcriptional regulator n=1 Tax=Salinibacterium sp. M195 TaxID=2583374 RepID=UPI002104B111|nr:GntR family transcriptional regulator [Salinibacterium sp. M195]
MASTLRAALIAGELVPGRVYSAPTLAKQLGVSATPVREAMLDLVRDGMVDVAPNTGFRITALTAAELDNIAEIRLLLEVPIMGQIAAARSSERDEQLELLRPLVDSMIEAAERQDLTQYLATDTLFHTRFLALHGNDVAVTTVQRLRDRSRLDGLTSVAQAGNLVESTREHYAMIDAALSHDRPAMEQLMRKHLGHVRTDWAAPSATSDA